MPWILPTSSIHRCSRSRTTESRCSAALCHCQFIPRIRMNRFSKVRRTDTVISSEMQILQLHLHSLVMCSCSTIKEETEVAGKLAWFWGQRGKLCKCQFFSQAYRTAVNAEIHITDFPILSFGLQYDRWQQACTIFLTSLPPPWNPFLFY